MLGELDLAGGPEPANVTYTEKGKVRTGGAVAVVNGGSPRTVRAATYCSMRVASRRKAAAEGT